MTWQTWRGSYPGGRELSTESGNRDYTIDAYSGYEKVQAAHVSRADPSLRPEQQGLGIQSCRDMRE